MNDVVLVTGATGNVGAEVVKALSRAGVAVRAGIHTRSKADVLRGPGVELVELAFDTPSTIDAALRGVTSVFLLTPFARPFGEGPAHLVDEARKQGVASVVHLSMLGADAATPTAAARGHRELEQHIEASGLRWTFLRPGALMQSFVTFYGGTMRSDCAVFLPLGDARVAWVHGRDVARVAARALTSTAFDGRAIPLSGPQALRAAEAAEALSRTIGRTVRYIDVPDEAARRTFRDHGFPDEVARDLVELHDWYRNGGASEVIPTMASLLGAEPTPFEDYAREIAPLFR